MKRHVRIPHWYHQDPWYTQVLNIILPLNQNTQTTLFLDTYRQLMRSGMTAIRENAQNTLNAENNP